MVSTNSTTWDSRTWLSYKSCKCHLCWNLRPAVATPLKSLGISGCSLWNTEKTCHYIWHFIILFFFTNMECIFRWSGALRVWGTISQIFTNQTIHTTTKYSAGFYPFNFEKPITKKKSVFIMIISQRTQKYIVYSTQNVFLFLILKFALVILKFSLDLKRI